MELSKKLKEMEKVVEELFLVNDKPYLLYHNINHTRNVVKRVLEIAAVYSLNEEDLFVLQAAAWFHDTGHLFSNMAQHEEMSVQIMRIYLGDQLEEQMLTNIGNCILATNIKVNPVSLIEKILCDADTYHFGTPEFHITDPLVWREMEKRLEKTIVRKDEKSLHLLELHTFYTPYCVTLLNKGKQDNIEWLKQKIAGSDS
jgi:hypothetical protein